MKLLVSDLLVSARMKTILTVIVIQWMQLFHRHQPYFIIYRKKRYK